MPSATHNAASSAIGSRVSRLVSTAPAAPSERGIPRKPIAKTLTKQVTASPAVQSKEGARDGKHDFDCCRGQERRTQYRLQGQPLADKAVERRQSRDRQYADKKETTGSRHSLRNAAEPVEIAGAGAGLDGTGADKQQRL